MSFGFYRNPEEDGRLVLESIDQFNVLNMSIQYYPSKTGD